uniref:Secreted protein n=1 Tax=Ixodes ricinus TaxID=34613 RepID=A0A6B0UAV7_IXORI
MRFEWFCLQSASLGICWLLVGYRQVDDVHGLSRGPCGLLCHLLVQGAVVALVEASGRSAPRCAHDGGRSFPLARRWHWRRQNLAACG